MYNSCRGDVFVQTLCSGAWNIFSDPSTVIAWGGGEIPTAALKTFGRTHPHSIPGKPEPITVTVTYEYQEGAADLTGVLRTAYENSCNHSICFRWIPRGNTAGMLQYTTISGIVTTMPYPGGDTGPEHTVIETTIVCDRVETDEIV